MKRKKLSVCLVVRNEETYLCRCLDSIKEVADETVVVDTGSTDRTIELAQTYTDKIFRYEWNDDFSAARNFALSKARGQWVLVIDGDEELAPGSGDKLREIVNNSEADGYLIKVINYFEDGSQQAANQDIIFRLFRNRKSYRYSGVIHEQICDNILSVNPSAKIEICEDIALIHYGYLQENIILKNKTARNLSLLEKTLKEDPANTLNRFHLGVEYFRVQRYQDSLDQFQVVMSDARPDSIYGPKLYRYITQCLVKLDNNADALSFIENTWLKHYPEHGDAHFLMGMVCHSLGIYDQAFRSFDKCLRLREQSAFYANVYCQQTYKIHYEIGRLAEYYMDLESALEHYMEVLKTAPGFTGAMERILHILKPADNPGYTSEVLNRIFDLSDPEAKLLVGRLLFKERAYDLALQYLTHQQSGSAHPSTLLLIGMCLMRTGRFSEAVAQLSLIPEGDSFYATAQGSMYLCYCIGGHPRKAARCLKSLRQHPELFAVLERLLKNKPQHGWDASLAKEELLSVVWEVIERLIELGELDRVEKFLDNCSGVFDARPARRLAGLFHEYKHYEKAEAEYKSLLVAESVDADLYYRLGLVCGAQKKLSEAEECFYTASALGLNTPEFLCRSARLYQELALQALEEGLQEYPGHPSVLKLYNQVKEHLIEV